MGRLGLLWCTVVLAGCTKPEDRAIEERSAMVTTRSVNRLEGGKLVGTIEARYTTKSNDSVVYRRSEGTRAP